MNSSADSSTARAGPPASSGRRADRSFAPRLTWTLAAIYLLALLYLSLLPLGSGPACYGQLTRIGWLGLNVRAGGLRDIASNIALYVPLGLLLQAGWPRRLAWPVRLALSLTAALLASIVAENAQRLAAGRDPSLVDVTSNLAGALIGAMLAAPVRSWAHGLVSQLHRQLRDRPLLLGAQALAAALLLHSAMPLDAATSADRLRRALRQAEVIPFARLVRWNHQARSAASLGDHLQMLAIRRQRMDFWADLASCGGRFALLAVLMSLALRREYQFGPLGAMTLSLWVCALVAALCSAIELLIVSRGLDGSRFVARVAFAAAAAAAAVLSRPARAEQPTSAAVARPGPRLVHAARLLLIMQAGYIVYRGLVPFSFWPLQAQPWPAWRTAGWLPLHGLLWSPLPLAAQSLWSNLTCFAILGVLAWLAIGPAANIQPGKKRLAIAAAVIVLASALEAAQLFIPTRVPDITTPLVAAIGALGGVAVYRRCAELYHANRPRSSAAGRHIALKVARLAGQHATLPVGSASGESLRARKPQPSQQAI